MLALDHVTLAARDLERLTQPFVRAGLSPDYGGAHANGVTHMAMLGLADGSYVEFIAPTAALPETVIWREFMAVDAGPAAWCVDCASSLASEVERLRARGVA